MLATCAEPGCETFVLGGFCLQHERPQTRVFVRGRPFGAPAPASRASVQPEAMPALGNVAVALSTRLARVTVPG